MTARQTDRHPLLYMYNYYKIAHTLLYMLTHTQKTQNQSVHGPVSHLGESSTFPEKTHNNQFRRTAKIKSVCCCRVLQRSSILIECLRCAGAGCAQAPPVLPRPCAAPARRQNSATLPHGTREERDASKVNCHASILYHRTHGVYNNE